MFLLIKQLFNVLTYSQRRRFFTLQLLMILMAFSEIGGVSAIGMFMAVVANQGILNGSNLIAQLYGVVGFNDPYDFIFLMGLAVLFVLLLAATVSILTVWRISLFANKVGAEMSDSLYRYYIHQAWLFHTASSSAQLTKKIASETSRVTTQILNPLLQMNAKIILAISMIVGLVIVNPIVVLMVVTIFLGAYLLLYKIVRKRLINNGRTISEMYTRRFQLMSEGFGGIKDVLLLGRQAEFTRQFLEAGDAYAFSSGTNGALALIPKYFMEFIAFSTVILLVLYLTKSYQGDLSALFPVLAVYALAGFKILPAFQQVYAGAATIRGAIPSFESIKVDLGNSISNEDERSVEEVTTEDITFNRNITLKNVLFSYPKKQYPSLKDINLKIPANKTIAFVGATGSGKSTLVDMVLGLILPSSGSILIDGVPLTCGNLRQWQNKIGFVPQSIFLADASIKENVAFGLPKEAINVERVKQVLALAHLNEFISELPEGINARVGERGVQLSGGQRQRIGIARSLYHNPEVLVFDEATSALDGITEKIIMEAVNSFSGNKTIIMVAHRLTTIQNCDIIYFMSNGRVIDYGTYEQLMNKCELFKQMATSHK